jgi:alpha-L-rhamnosidase
MLLLALKDFERFISSDDDIIYHHTKSQIPSPKTAQMKKNILFNMRILIALLIGILPLFAFSKERPTASFITPLDDSSWENSKWISVADAPVVEGRVDEDTRAADGASWFVATVKNSKKVVSAKWMTTALGVYLIYVNGKEIGSEVLKPGFTHCFKTKRSFTYDVTAEFNTKAGAENILSAQVTPGWWADKIITPSGSHGMYGTRCAFRGVLELTFADGSKEYHGTDTASWKAGIAGPVKHAAIFDGEEYDAREKMGFEAISQLKQPEENTEFEGVILPTNGAEIYLRHDLALSPARAYIWKDVDGKKEQEHGKIVVSRSYDSGRNMTVHAGEHLVLDFGQNCAAVPSFVFQAKGGVQLTCLPAELLNDGNGAEKRGMDGPEGSIHRQNLRIHKKSIRLDYTFADTHKAVEFTPQCTFFGYRFLDITATGDVTIKEIRSIPVSSITQEMESGRITTGNELINKLISNTVWGMRSNYLSVPTDCPQRNERLGWTADTQVFATTGTFFADTDRFFHKWLHDLRDSQSDKGGYPGVSPFGQYGSWTNENMRVGWADAGIIVPWTVWKQFGDKRIIEESWASMERYMDHLNATRYDHNALSGENGNYQWADWLSYEPLESCGGGAFKSGKPLPEAIAYWNYLCASYWAIDAAMMRDMAAASGHDTQKYEQMTADAKAYIRSQFLNDQGDFKTEILNTMQTPALFLLKNGIIDGEAKERIISRLRQNFADHGNCLQTGFLGTSILMSTLTDNGMTDIAYDLLFQRKNPSWLYSIDNGATTIWERWNSYTLENGMGPRGMNSFNHYAYGCVCQWLWETASGIAADTAAPGFRHIIMCPIPDKRLGHIEAKYRSAAGIIKSSWRYKGNEWIWTFTIPEGSTATVTLPGETESKNYTAGTYTVRKQLH